MLLRLSSVTAFITSASPLPPFHHHHLLLPFFLAILVFLLLLLLLLVLFFKILLLFIAVFRVKDKHDKRLTFGAHVAHVHLSLGERSPWLKWAVRRRPFDHSWILQCKRAWYHPIDWTIDYPWIIRWKKAMISSRTINHPWIIQCKDRCPLLYNLICI